MECELYLNKAIFKKIMGDIIMAVVIITVTNMVLNVTAQLLVAS